MNYQTILQARDLASIVPHNITADDTCAALVVQYVPKKGVSEDYRAKAAFTQGGNFTFTTGTAGDTVVGNSGATLDGIGTAGVIDTSAASFNTVGEFGDYVNGHPAYRAIRKVPYATPMAHVLTKSASFCDVANGLTFYIDTSVGKANYVAISGEQFVNNGINGHRKETNCENWLCYGEITLTATGALTLYIYSSGQNSLEGDALIHQETLTSTSLKQLGLYQTPDVPWLKSARGRQLIVKVAAATSINAQTLFLINGKTIVEDGRYLITSKGY